MYLFFLSICGLVLFILVIQTLIRQDKLRYKIKHLETRLSQLEKPDHAVAPTSIKKTNEKPAQAKETPSIPKEKEREVETHKLKHVAAKAPAKKEKINISVKTEDKTQTKKERIIVKKAAPKPKREKPKWLTNAEQYFLANWTGLLGVLFLILGIGFISLYAALKFSAVFRFGGLVLLSAVFVVIHQVLKKRSEWKELASWILSASAAIFLFACLGAGGLPGLLFIHSPLPALALLCLGICVNLAMAWSSPAQRFAAFHAVISLAALLPAPSIELTLILASITSASVVALRFRRQWEWSTAIVLTAFTAFHFFWKDNNATEGISSAIGIAPNLLRIFLISAVHLLALGSRYFSSANTERLVKISLLTHSLNWLFYAVNLFPHTQENRLNVFILSASALALFLLALKAWKQNLRWLANLDMVVSKILVFTAIYQLRAWDIQWVLLQPLAYSVSALLFAYVSFKYKNVILFRFSSLVFFLAYFVFCFVLFNTPAKQETQSIVVFSSVLIGLLFFLRMQTPAFLNFLQPLSLENRSASSAYKLTLPSVMASFLYLVLLLRLQLLPNLPMALLIQVSLSALLFPAVAVFRKEERPLGVAVDAGIVLILAFVSSMLLAFFGKGDALQHFSFLSYLSVQALLLLLLSLPIISSNKGKTRNSTYSLSGLMLSITALYFLSGLEHSELWFPLCFFTFSFFSLLAATIRATISSSLFAGLCLTLLLFGGGFYLASGNAEESHWLLTAAGVFPLSLFILLQPVFKWKDISWPLKAMSERVPPASMALYWIVYYLLFLSFCFKDTDSLRLISFYLLPLSLLSYTALLSSGRQKLLSFASGFFVSLPLLFALLQAFWPPYALLICASLSLSISCYAYFLEKKAVSFSLPTIQIYPWILLLLQLIFFLKWDDKSLNPLFLLTLQLALFFFSWSCLLASKNVSHQRNAHFLSSLIWIGLGVSLFFWTFPVYAAVALGLMAIADIELKRRGLLSKQTINTINPLYIFLPVLTLLFALKHFFKEDLFTDQSPALLALSASGLFLFIRTEASMASKSLQGMLQLSVSLLLYLSLSMFVSPEVTVLSLLMLHQLFKFTWKTKAESSEQNHQWIFLLSLIALAHFEFFLKIYSSERGLSFVSWRLLIGLVIAAFWLLQARQQTGKNFMSTLYRWRIELSLITLVLLVFSDILPVWQSTAISLLALASLLTTVFTNRSRWFYNSFALLSLASVLLSIELTRQLFPTDSLDSRYLPGISSMLINILFLTLVFYVRKKKTLPWSSKTKDSVIATNKGKIRLLAVSSIYIVLISSVLFIFWVAPAYAISVSLVALGFIVFVLSLILREGHLRFTAMTGLLGVIIRLVFWDLRQSGTLARAFAFIIVGFLMVLMNLLYKRFSEKREQNQNE